MKRKNKPKKTFSLKLRDSFLYDILIIISVIMVWRGIWNILDSFLLPDHPVLSSLLSIGIGMFIIYLPDQDLKDIV